MRQRLSATLWTLTLSLCLSLIYSEASAYGLFLTEEGPASGPHARVLVTPTATGVRLMIQGEYTGTPNQSAFWLIPVPNVTNLDDDPPRLLSINSASLDELVEMSAPRFEGACEGEPNGQSSTEALPLRSGEVSATRALAFNAVKLTPPVNNPEGETDLHRYLTNAGMNVTAEVDELIRWTLDQNLMMLLFEFEPGALTPSSEGPEAGADPTVDIELTVDSNALRVALKPLSLSVMGRATDVVFWVLAQERFRASFPTRELDMSEVSFGSDERTDYLPRFDLLAQTQQSQVFITEYVSTLNAMSFEDERLATLRNEVVGTKLTRLRARLIPAALSTNAQVISLRADPGANYERAHRVQGYMCPEPMAGVEAGIEAGIEAGAEVEAGAEAGVEAGTEAGVEVEAGTEAGGEAGVEIEAGVEAGVEVEAGAEVGAEPEMSSSSNDGGCAQRSAPHNTPTPIFTLLLALSSLTLILRRRFTL